MDAWTQRRSWVKILGDALKKNFFWLLSDARGSLDMLKFFRAFSTQNHKKIKLNFYLMQNDGICIRLLHIFFAFSRF